MSRSLSELTKNFEPRFKNNKLVKELDTIAGVSYDRDQVLARQIHWANASINRRLFIESVERDLVEEGYKLGKKDRAKEYSSRVCAYDMGLINDKT